ncbi:hypothetical protein Y032_0394g630 [Ancylostoma ceylanicum]|uniref:SPK domain-containing protein n=1 Tax=Ancylostoma ceylanicum TaxID=53326 RepID=A0A016RRW5_9BILA|nr:hypothetical protein Y032_0394g630 [Ancylostoma ceylanicum]
MVKERQPYSRLDETSMWSYLYDKLRAAHPAAAEPKGLKIWTLYAREMKVHRSADSLCTRFRRHMVDRLYDANLPCHKMMFLYSRLGIPMNSDVKVALELKFGIQIELNRSMTLKNFRAVERPVADAERCPAGISPQRSRPAENQGEAEQPSELPDTPSPPTRGSLNYTQQIRNVQEESRLQARREAMVVSSSTISASERFLHLQITDDDFDSLESPCSSGVATQRSPQEEQAPAPTTSTQPDHSPSSQGEVAFPSRIIKEIRTEVPPVQQSTDESTEASSVSANPSNSENRVTDDIVVSTVSDSCKNSLQRVYDALGVSNPGETQDWRNSERILSATTLWQNKMHELIESYGLRRSTANAIEVEVLNEQRNLLGKSTTKGDYLRSLLTLKSVLKRELENLAKGLGPSTIRPPVAQAHTAPLPFMVRNTKESKVPLAKRLECLRRCTSKYDHSMHTAYVQTSLKRLAMVESLAVASASNEADYDHLVAEVENVVDENISKIPRCSNP